MAKKTDMAVSDYFDRLSLNENPKKSVTIWKIFESCSSISLEMATVWSEHHYYLSIEGDLYF